ncbi:hypothetical protein J7E91_32355 [Streptomyces sp. ISL-99]|uniref:hypothetical protein n=1 Tax=Streptomyces sp. ISL-99 TaxID=2819193 RepID=UPI001BE8AC72|nr:hypothetical protein [Streptomyces sp. ISL-99]MBT2529929.1 hypothetical protein [Streptomyces sp. ISL-99]
MLLTADRICPLVLRGQRVQAAITVFEDEAQRRAAAGLGALDQRSLLTFLFNLPAGVPVPLDQLDASDRRRASTAPSGVVEVDQEHGVVVRRIVPVVRVEQVLVHAKDWDQGVRLASQFGPFCTRAFIVPEGTPDTDLIVLKARYYGVGVAVQAPGGSSRWLLEPAPYRPRRHSPAQWLFHEQAWRQMGSWRR